MPLTPLIIPAVRKHTATVIMAHGLGDSGAGWVDIGENWRRRQSFEEVKFIFPNAPSIPITVNMGMRMPGWYDILSFGDLRDGQDEPGILKSRDYFHSLIKEEIDAGIPSDRIVLGGFSQGGAMSIFSGITAPTKLGGIFGLSSYLLLHSKIKEFIPADSPNQDTPIFMGHGDSDPLVKPEWGQMTASFLKVAGFNVDLKMYPEKTTEPPSQIQERSAPKSLDVTVDLFKTGVKNASGNEFYLLESSHVLVSPNTAYPSSVPHKAEDLRADECLAMFVNPSILTILVLVTAIILAPSTYITVTRSFFHTTARAISNAAYHLVSPNMTPKKTPVYFLSHGGPNIMYEVGHPVYPQLQAIGREITQKVKPRAIVVFSAHWRGEPNTIEINTAESTDLIYDFYGFPEHYYKEIYPNKGNAQVAQEVINAATASGIKTSPVRRGLDHGVWASFKVAFDPVTNPLNIPIVQVSLFDTEDPHQHYALGKAVSSLRSEGIQIIVSGMAVHNLRDLSFVMREPGKIMPYAKSFDEALRDAVEGDVEGREERMAELLKRSDARPAHPSFEHLLPIHIGAGAAGDDKGVRLWTLAEGSFSWAQYRFGDVPTA